MCSCWTFCMAGFTGWSTYYHILTQGSSRQIAITTRLPDLNLNAPHPPTAANRQVVAIGSTNKVVGGGCEGGCAWDTNLSVDDIAFAIEKSQLASWIADVRRITYMDLQDSGRAPDRWGGGFWGGGGGVAWRWCWEGRGWVTARLQTS
jgi:hypothetical protein